jgi:hypothetical protein
MEEKERVRLGEAMARSEAAGVEDRVLRLDTTASRDRVEAHLVQQPDLATAKSEFDALAAEERTRVEGMAASQRDASAMASRARASQLSAMSAGRIQAFQAIADGGTLPGDRQSLLLQTPFEVSVIGAAMTDHSIVPGASYSRFEFRLGEDRNSNARTHFSYVWQNPTNRYALIDAHGYVILDGSVAAICSGGFWPRDRRAEITVTPRLSLLDWGQEPLAPDAQTHLGSAAWLKVEDKSPLTLGPMASMDVFRGYDLALSQYIVKPHGTVGLVVAVDLSGDTGHDGEVWADFASGNHRVVSPGVLILVIS